MDKHVSLESQRPAGMVTDTRAYNPYTGRWGSGTQEEDHKLLGYIARTNLKIETEDIKQTINMRCWGWAFFSSVLASFTSAS